jgi:uncharacterized alpha-E superfamily protein
VISRVADHCFWVGRYIERAESTARLLQVTRALAFDAELPPLHCWRPLMIVSGQFPEFAGNFGADAAGHGDVVQRYMTWAPENPVSIRTSVRAAREGARSIREVLGHEIWQATNEMYLWFAGEEAAASYIHDRDEVYRNVRRSTQLCLGLVRSTMLHDEPMDFLWLGVLLERIGQTARILDMHHHIQSTANVGDPQPLLQTALWLSLLRACSGFEAFMRREQGRVSREAAVSFLLFEARFPRSLRYCVRSALALARRLDSAEPPRSLGTKGAVTAARDRLETLDRWLDTQEAKDLPLTVHALLTHVVDEASTACQELQQGVEGATAVAARAQKAEAAQ